MTKLAVPLVFGGVFTASVEDDDRRPLEGRNLRSWRPSHKSMFYTVGKPALALKIVHVHNIRHHSRSNLKSY